MEAFPFREVMQAQGYEAIERIPADLVLDCVRSLYNVGAFFRSADGAGIGKLYLTGYTGRPPYPRIAKMALGAEKSVTWDHKGKEAPLLQALRGKGREIAAIEISRHSVDLYDWQPRFPVCLVFGNAVGGVSTEVSELSDVHIRIPTLGVKQSLNVAVAGCVVVYELLRKYRGLHGADG